MCAAASGPAVRSIGLVVHSGRPGALPAADAVRGWARGNGASCTDVDVWTEGPDGRLDCADQTVRATPLDLIITIGGDGTFLRGVRVGTPRGTPVLGVNVGRVGFLTDVPTDQIERALDAVAAGRHHVDARLTLTMRASRPLEVPADMGAFLRYGRGPTLPPPAPRPAVHQQVGWGVALDVLALNDVVFEKLARDRQASVAVYDTGRLFASYSADALIVATSTGSTAYSFAAGGPILSPELEALIFTPVAPHMIFDRSLVVSRRQRIGIRVLERSGRVAVSVDGAVRGVLGPGDWVSVYAGPHRARLVRLAASDFPGRVRTRFRLADAAAAIADGSSPATFEPDGPPPPDLADPGPPD